MDMSASTTESAGKPDPGFKPGAVFPAEDLEGFAISGKISNNESNASSL